MSATAEKMRGNTGGAKAGPWTSKELQRLRQLAKVGFGAVGIAEELGRSVKSVKRQAERHRVSLRRPGESRGILLGQPRGKRWADRNAALRALRDETLSGDVDIARVERRVRALYDGTPLCPSCTRRPQEVETTGLCEDCHLRALAEGHRLELERAEAQRELDRERQRKHRRRRGEGVA